VTLPSDREIVLTREFDAPRRLVFEAMTKPEYIRQWWGPRGTSLAVCEMELRPAGSWRFVTRAADGTEHPFKGEYLQIVPPERIVQTFVYDVAPFSDFEAVETMVLHERDGRTMLTSTVVHQSTEARDAHLQSGMEQGASETFDRLAELLASMQRGAS
jgi:uncharacterized protein YndB with AHSA1/START domain